MGLAEHNPVIGTLKLGEEVRRDHVVADEELKAIWDACGPNDYGRIVRLLLLTAQRRDEVGSMHWSEIDLQTGIWVIPAPRSKNGRPHEVPLPPAALAIIREAPRMVGRDLIFGSGRGGFSGWSKAKRELDTKVASASRLIRPWRLHDLRRTAATGMATIGIQPHIVEAVLNHVSGSRAGVAGIYNRATYRQEKRDALNTWASYVNKVCNVS
jgi:integrase